MNGKLRLFVGFALTSFFVTVASIIVAGTIVYRRAKEADMISRNTSSFADLTTNTQADAGSAGQTTITLDAAGVAQHNTPGNCWIIINSGVYDVTTFLTKHPGGSLVMTPYCGKDGTRAYQTKDKNPATAHSSTATSLLKQYFVGTLGQTLVIPNTGVSKPVSGGSTTALPKTGGSNPSPTPTSAPAVTKTTNTQLTSSSVASHNTSADCWIIISGTVYNVTSFLTSHPGGVNVISVYCGKDATTGFATKDQSPPSGHSAYAVGLLGAYRIGTLGSTVTAGTTTSGGNTGTTTVTTAPTVPPPAPTATPLPVTSSGYTTTNVSGHNTTSNCWIIISGKVYNVTNYLVQHPGGVNAISPYCGKDATNAFSTKGGRGSNHSNYAYSLLNSYFIGNVSTGGAPAPTIAPGGTNPTAAPTSATQPTSPPASGGSCTQGTLPQSILDKYPGATIKTQEVGDNCSQELEVNTSVGCRHIKTNSSGSITSDSSC